MRGRSAGAETTHRAVVASMTAQSATSNFVPSFNPYERRTQEQATLSKATANRSLLSDTRFGKGMLHPGRSFCGD